MMCHHLDFSLSYSKPKPWKQSEALPGTHSLVSSNLAKDPRITALAPGYMQSRQEECGVREGQRVLLPTQALIHARYPGLPERKRKQIARWFKRKAWSPDYLFFLGDTGLAAAHALNHSVLFCEMEVRSLLPVLFSVNWYCFQYLRLILHFHHAGNLLSPGYLMTYTRTLNSLRDSSSLLLLFLFPFLSSLPSSHSICYLQDTLCWMLGRTWGTCDLIEDNTGHEFQRVRSTFNFLLRKFKVILPNETWILERGETGPRVCHLSFSLFIYPCLGWRGERDGLSSDDQEKL